MESKALNDQRSEDAPEDAKYHPLIFQQTSYTQILATVDKISLEKKHQFLGNFYNSFKNILSCNKCSDTIKVNSIVFSCQHKFCEKCSNRISKCLLCSNTGHDFGSRLHRDLSGLLSDIISIQKNFNAESALFQLVKFLVTPSYMQVAKNAIRERRDSNCSTPRAPTRSELNPKKTRGKFTSTSKRFKTNMNKPDNSKRKLLFTKDVSVSPKQTQLPEHDSALLFLNSSNKDKNLKNEKIVQSYLNQQESIDQSPKFDNGLKTYTKIAKRKLSCTDINTESTEENLKKPKAQENSAKNTLYSKRRSSFVLGGDKTETVVSSVRRSRRKLKPEVFSASSSDVEFKGTFPGFERTCVTESYNKLKLMKNYYEDLHDKLTKSDVDPNVNYHPLNVVDESKNDDDILKSESNRLQDAVPNLENRNERSLRRNCRTIEIRKKEVNVLAKIPELKPTIVEIENEGQKNNVDEKISKAENTVDKKEKENLDINLPDYDIEDVVDIKLWDMNDRPTRKKKTLFKSLKERKKKNVLLKLLEEKRLEQKDENKILAPEVQAIELKMLEQNDLTSTKENSLTDVEDKPPEGESTPPEDEQNCYTPILPQENISLIVTDAPIKESPHFEPEPLADNAIGRENPTPKTPEVLKQTDTLESMPTPLLKHSRFIDTISSPLAAPSDLVEACEFVNTSTPIVRNKDRLPYETPKSCQTIVQETPINENSSSIIASESNSPEGKICHDFDREVVPSEMTPKQKCARLKRTINSQNQKSLFSLKKNFRVNSPQSLLIEKSKLTFSAKKDAKNSEPSQPKSEITTPESASSDKANNNLIPENDFDDLLTLPSSLATKSVACQTTPDLHVSLLMQEFPHLFQRSSLPLSVYDTPTESVTKSGDKNLFIIKTPESSFTKCNPAKYTSISSVTSSEKKRADEEFASRSILCDSVRTPFSCIGTNSSPADISCISPLPSTDKKPLETSQDSEKRRLSVRLTFQGDENEMKESPSIIVASGDNTVCSKVVISCDSCERGDMTLKTITSENREVVEHILEEKDGKRYGSLNASNEIEFMDVNEEQEKGKSSMDSGLVCATPDLDYVPDSAVLVPEDVEIFTEEETGFKSPERDNSDDEDIDFIAGTPTCYEKRGVENSSQKLISQSDIEEISTLEKSHLLFDSLEQKSSKTETQQNPIIETSTANYSLLNNVSAVSNPGRQCSRKKADSPKVRAATCRKLVYFVTSGLKDDDIRLTRTFCEKFPVILQDKLNDESTHLIVKTDSENHASRTFKYLQAIVNRIYIVSIHWVEECLRHGCIVDEEHFIPLDSSNEFGPLRCYNVAKGLTPSPLSWLCDYCIFFLEPIPHGCTLVQLQEIVRKTGATVVGKLDEMKMYPGHHHVIIVSDEDENMDLTKNITNWLQNYQAVAIEFNWLLEVIGRNRLVPFAEHEFVEIPREILQRLNFPDEMLEPDVENND